MQYAVIHAAFSHLNHSNSSAVFLISWWEVGRRKKEISQKIDDLLVLATCRSGVLAILSSKVSSPVAHESTR